MCVRTSVTTVPKLQDRLGGALKKKVMFIFHHKSKENEALSFKYKHHFIHAISHFFDSDHLHLLKPPTITPQTSSLIKNILVLHEIGFKKHSVTLHERTETNKNVINSTTNGNQLLLIL